MTCNAFQIQSFGPRSIPRRLIIFSYIKVRLSGRTLFRKLLMPTRVLLNNHPRSIDISIVIFPSHYRHPVAIK